VVCYIPIKPWNVDWISLAQNIKKKNIFNFENFANFFKTSVIKNTPMSNNSTLAECKTLTRRRIATCQLDAINARIDNLTVNTINGSEESDCFIVEGSDTALGPPIYGTADVCHGERLRIWSQTIDINVQQGSALVNLEYDIVNNLCLQKSLAFDAQNCLGYAITYGQTLFVATTGSDVTGARERLDCPFATPWAAVAAAQPGDTVIVFPGTYTSAAPAASNQRLVAHLVRTYCYPGVIIQFTNFAGPLPFFDDGNPMVAEFRGFATILSNVVNFGNNVMLTNAASDLILEANRFQHLVRLFISNCRRFHYTVKEDVTTLIGHAVAVRLPANTDADIKYHTDTMTLANVRAWTPYDFRNIGINGQLDVWAGQLNLFGTSNEGIAYIQTVTAHKKIHVDSVVQNQNAGADPTYHRAILVMRNPQGSFDIKFPSIENADGNGYHGNTIVTRGAGASPATGSIELAGTWVIDCRGAGGVDPSNNLNSFDPDSRINVKVSANVFGSDNALYNRAFLNLTNAPSFLTLSGRIKYQMLSGTNQTLNNCLQWQNNSVRAPILRELIAVTDFDIAPPAQTGPISNTALGPAAGLPMYNVFSNRDLSSIITSTPFPGEFQFDPAVDI